MIEARYAIGTVSAMCCVLRPKNQACLTKLHHLDPRIRCVCTLRSFTLEHKVFYAILHEKDVSVAFVDVWFSIL